MTIRFNLTLAIAAALCVVGCNKDEQSTGPKKESGAPTATTPPAASATTAPPVAATTPPAAATTAPPAAATTPAPAAANAMITTASGLKYQVLKRGTGTVSPKATDTVKVHYHGTLLDGTVFDSSVQRGVPATFPLNRVIPGWTEGVQLMKVGDKFKFEIPPNLAYGPRSPSPQIPPNSTLVFEVELLEIQ
jgi:FKBP-type peptidyl-prolyl cis-trans isomerase